MWVLPSLYRPACARQSTQIQHGASCLLTASCASPGSVSSFQLAPVTTAVSLL